jgi:hypothetical protein
MTQHLNSVQKQRILCKENIWHCLFHALLLDNPSIQNTVRFQCRFQSCSYYFLTTSICSGKTRANFFPYIFLNDIVLGFKVVSGYAFPIIWLCFSHFIGQKPNSTRFWVVTMYTSSLSPQYTHLTLACQHTHSALQPRSHTTHSP